MLILVFVIVGCVSCSFVFCFLSCLLTSLAKGSGDWQFFKFSKVSLLIFVRPWVPNYILNSCKAEFFFWSFRPDYEAQWRVCSSNWCGMYLGLWSQVFFSLVLLIPRSMLSTILLTVSGSPVLQTAGGYTCVYGVCCNWESGLAPGKMMRCVDLDGEVGFGEQNPISGHSLACR